METCLLEAHFTFGCSEKEALAVEQALYLLPIFGKAFLNYLCPHTRERNASSALQTLEIVEVLFTPAISSLSCAQQIVRFSYPAFNIDLAGNVDLFNTDTGPSIHCVISYSDDDFAKGESVMDVIQRRNPNYLIFIHAVLRAVVVTRPNFTLFVTPIAEGLII